MPLLIKPNGHLLMRPSGAPAVGPAGEDCCCGPPPEDCFLCAPGTTPGTVMVTLSGFSDENLVGTSCTPSDFTRPWSALNGSFVLFPLDPSEGDDPCWWWIVDPNPEVVHVIARVTSIGWTIAGKIKSPATGVSTNCQDQTAGGGATAGDCSQGRSGDMFFNSVVIGQFVLTPL